MTEIVSLVQDSPEGGLEARALCASVYTEADTFDELREMVRDAVNCHFSENERPKLVRLHYARDEIFTA